MLNMFSIYLFIICIIHFCKTDYSSFENDDTLNITRKVNYRSMILLEPLCVNKNNILIQGKYNNSHWHPAVAPQCHRIQKPFEPKCVGNDKNISNICIHYKPLQPWSSDVPVITVQPINNTLHIARRLLNITDMWLPVKRIKQYGKFVWVHPYPEVKYKTYNHTLLYSMQHKNSYKYDCIAATNITVDGLNVNYVPKFVDCNSSFATVYTYLKHNRYFVINNKVLRYVGPIFYSTKGNKAFYIQNTNQGKKCRKLAEPRYEEDNFLIKQLIEKRTCSIGITFVNNTNTTNFIWISTREPINYTDWIPSTDFSLYKVVISKTGWSLNERKNIHCAVCEIDQSKYVTDLILTPTKNHSKLMLTAYSFFIKYISISCEVIGLDDIFLNINTSEVTVTNKYDSKYNQIENINNRTIWSLSSDIFNYYQCFGSMFPYGEDVATKQVFFFKSNVNEFAFVVTLKMYCLDQICDPYLNRNYTNIFPNIFSTEPSEFFIISIRAKQILSIDDGNGDINLLYHVRIRDKIRTFPDGYEQLRKEFHILNNKLTKISVDLNSLKSCLGCPPSKTEINGVTLFWDFTETGVIAKPNASSGICIQSNYLPVTRNCSGNYLDGGQWMNVVGKCDENMQITNVTKNLHKLSKEINSFTVTEIANKLAMNTNKSTSLMPFDVVLVSQIFKDISKPNITGSDNTTIIAKEVSMTLSNLVATNYSSLQLASMNLNSTNVILSSIESFMEEIAQHNLDSRGVFQQIESNFMYHLLDPFVENITGIALFRPKTKIKSPLFTDYTTELLTANTTIEDLIEKDDLEAAAFIPTSLLEHIKNNSSNKNVKISMIFYYNDSLFIENGNEPKSKVYSKVFSISISGYTHYLHSPIPVIFKNVDQTHSYNCGYWYFGTKTYDAIYYNQWNIDNTLLPKYKPDKNIQICEFNHLTNLALLLRISFQESSPNDTNSKFYDHILTYLTLIGSILSVFGIFAIFTTAAVFKTWRNKSATKVLLNVSICILLKIVLLYGNLNTDAIACIITGSLLHYIVLCEFTWSLIMAYLQYWKFVQVLGKTTSHLILKAFFIGWIGPLIPVAVVLILKLTKYLPNDLENYGKYICYPDGIILYTIVYLPVGIIIAVNLITFCIIIYKVHTQTAAMKKFRHNYDEREMIIKQIKLAIFLFFSLSLTWIFGLLAISQYCELCVYLFVVTGSIQGFVLFVYYVLVNKDIRLHWIKLIKSSRLMPSSITATTSKSNLTNEDNEMNTLKKNQIETPKNNLNIHHNNAEEKIQNTEDNFKESNLKKCIHPLNQDELRKRNVVHKEGKSYIIKKRNSNDNIIGDYDIKSEGNQLTNELSSHELMKKHYSSSSSCENYPRNVTNHVPNDSIAVEETIPKKTYVPLGHGYMQHQSQSVMQELMKQQDKRNSPFRK